MNIKIYLVEDEIITAEAISLQLSQMGYDVIGRAVNGEKAIQEVLQLDPDLILMDIKIKGPYDGIETAQRIQQTKRIPVIFLTAYAEMGIVEKAKKADPFGYLIKPFNAAEVNTNIQMALHKFNLEHELETALIKKDEALKQKNTLLKELNHRVKNNLQIVSGLLYLETQSLTDTLAKKILANCKSRIDTMALIHEKLYHANEIDMIDLKNYVATLLMELSSGLGINSEIIKINNQINIEKIDLDSAIVCGLILNEIVTNSIKHAFPDQQSGTITIQAKKINSEMELTIADDGIGFKHPNNENTIQGFGTRLIKLLATEQLEGTLFIENQVGTCYKIVFTPKTLISS